MENIKSDLRKDKIIAILRGVPNEKLIPLCNALFSGGIRFAEVTYDKSGTVSDAETAKNIKTLAKEFDGKMYIGAGTVLTVKQVKLAKKAGAKFIVSPDTDWQVVTKTKKCGLMSIPGALTPTEIAAASTFGADFVKIFPVCSMPEGYIKLIKAPLSNIEVIAVGNVDNVTMEKYLSEGATGVCIGGYLTDKELLRKNNYEEITLRAKTLTESIKKYDK